MSKTELRFEKKIFVHRPKFLLILVKSIYLLIRLAGCWMSFLLWCLSSLFLYILDYREMKFSIVFLSQTLQRALLSCTYTVLDYAQTGLIAAVFFFKVS